MRYHRGKGEEIQCISYRDVHDISFTVKLATEGRCIAKYSIPELQLTYFGFEEKQKLWNDMVLDLAKQSGCDIDELREFFRREELVQKFQTAFFPKPPPTYKMIEFKQPELKQEVERAPFSWASFMDAIGQALVKSSEPKARLIDGNES